MEPDENRFGRVVAEFSLGFRDFAPHDHPSRQGIGLPLRDLSVALLSGEQERRSPVMSVDLSKIDAAVGGLLFPDLSNVAPPSSQIHASGGASRRMDVTPRRSSVRLAKCFERYDISRPSGP